MKMFYKFVSAILVIKLCDSASLNNGLDTKLNLPVEIPNEDAQYIDDEEASSMHPTLDILNELRKGGNYEDKSDPFNDFNNKIPKITVWTLNNERRAFLGDTEIFIDGTKVKDSGEDIDFVHEKLLHPHKNQLPEDTVIDAHELPPFKPRDKQKNIIKHSVGDVEPLNLISRRAAPNNILLLNRVRRSMDELETQTIKDEDVLITSKERTKRTLFLHYFLKWLKDNYCKYCENSEQSEETLEESDVSGKTQLAEIEEIYDQEYDYNNMVFKRETGDVNTGNDEIPNFIEGIRIGDLFNYLIEFLQNNKSNLNLIDDV